MSKTYFVYTASSARATNLTLERNGVARIYLRGTADKALRQGREEREGQTGAQKCHSLALSQRTRGDFLFMFPNSPHHPPPADLIGSLQTQVIKAANQSLHPSLWLPCECGSQYSSSYNYRSADEIVIEDRLSNIQYYVLHLTLISFPSQSPLERSAFLKLAITWTMFEHVHYIMFKHLGSVRFFSSSLKKSLLLFSKDSLNCWE